jgi:hypothetical protein
MVSVPAGLVRRAIEFDRQVLLLSAQPRDGGVRCPSCRLPLNHRRALNDRRQPLNIDTGPGRPAQATGGHD